MTPTDYCQKQIAKHQALYKQHKRDSDLDSIGHYEQLLAIWQQKEGELCQR